MQAREEAGDDISSQFFKKRHVERESELEKYLGAGLAQPNIKLLDWWKVRNSLFLLIIFIFFFCNTYLFLVS
jgi:hypothetical protein